MPAEEGYLLIWPSSPGGGRCLVFLKPSCWEGVRSNCTTGVLCRDSAPQDQQPKLSRTGSRDVFEAASTGFKICAVYVS